MKLITKDSKARLLLLATLFFSCLFIFRQYLFGNSVLVYNDVGGDTWQQYTAYYASVVNHLRAGNFAWWDFTNGLGINLFSWLQMDPSMILLFLIGVILGPAHMLYYLVVLQILKILAAGILFYMFLSEFSYSIPAKFLTAFVYGLNGYLLVWGQHYQFGMVTVYFPLMLLFAERYIRGKKGKAFFCVSVFLSGIYSVYLSYMSLIGIGFYLLFRSIMTEKRPGAVFRKFFIGCGQIVLGIGMSLGMFLPMAEGIMNSSRVSPASGGILEILKSYFLPYQNSRYYNSLLIRPFSTNLQNLQKLGKAKYEGYKNYYEDPVLFCSTLSVIFLVQFLIVFRKKEKDRKARGCVYGAVVLIMLTLLLPFGGRIFNAFTEAPTDRYTYILITFFLMIFAWMWDYLRQGGKVSILALLITEVLMLRAYFFGYSDSVFGEYRANALILAVTGTVMVACVLYLGTDFRQRGKKLATVLLVVMVFVNVIAEGGITYIDRICLRKTDTPEEQIAALEEETIRLEASEDSETQARAVLNRPQTYYRSLYSQDIQDALKYLRETDQEFYRVEKDFSSGTVSMDSQIQGYRGVSTYNSVMNGNVKEFVNTCYPEFLYIDKNRYTFWPIAQDTFFASFMGVRYLISENPNLDNTKYEQIAQFGKVFLYKNIKEANVARFYENTISEESLRRLCSGKNRKKNRERILENYLATEDGTNISEMSQLTEVPKKQKNSAVMIEIAEKDSHLTGSVSTQADGYVMCMIPWEKGWTVTVDGENVCTQRGDLGFLAFQVDEGEHQLELNYQVPGLKTGMVASAVCWCIYMAICLYQSRKKRENL